MCVCSGGGYWQTVIAVSAYGRPHLLLVLVLHAESLLDAVAGLQEGFPLGSLRQDAHKQPWQVDAGEEHRVCNQLQKKEAEKERLKKYFLKTNISGPYNMLIFIDKDRGLF